MRWLDSAHPKTWAAASRTDHYFVVRPRVLRPSLWPGHEREAFIGHTRRYGDRANLIGPELVDAFSGADAMVDRMRWERFVHHARDIVTSYPAPHAPKVLTPAFLATHPKDTTVVFAGTSSLGVEGPAAQRAALRQSFESAAPSSARWLELSNRRVLAEDIYAINARGHYGVVVAGDSLSSRRLFTLLAAQTIPVVLVDHLVLPFASVVDWREVVVFVPESEAFVNPAFNLIEYLERIPTARRNAMRAAGQRAHRAMTYHTSIVPGDAVDLIVRRGARSPSTASHP